MKRNFEKEGLLELKKSGALKQDVKDNETSPEHKKQSEYQHPIVTSMTLPGPCTLRIRPRLSTFAPTLSNLIPSARMGPPYPSANHILLMPRVISNNYRQKMISAVEPARSCPFVIHLDESSSSPSPSSSETEGDDTETSNNMRSIESEKVPLTIKEEISNSKYDNKAVMRVGASRGAPPIIVLSDSSDEEEISKQNLQPKARLSVRDQIPQKKVSNEFVMEISQLIGKSIDEDLLAIAQFGMEMIEVESMVHKLLNNCDTEKPKRVSKRAFYQCVKHGNNLPKVLAFLNAGLNPTERIKGVDGLTALHVAAMKGHLEILLLLIFKVGRKNVDCADKRNKTPLFYAIEKKHLKTAQFLVKVGADVHLANADGMTLLHIAARNGNLIFVKWLVSLGVSLNQQDNYGWTALMWATEHDSNAEIIKYLIKIGAHTNVLDNEMNICLHWAAMTSSFECVCELVNNPLYSHINACNRFGETPLHIAAKMDNYNIVQFLLASGADHTIKNFSGLTALNVCPIGSKTFHCIRIRDMVGEVQKTPYFYLTDISNGKERIPISCLNEVDNEPFPNDFIYISKPEESCHLKVNRGFSTVKPCKCEVSCGVDCKCIKLSENQRLWYTEDGKIDISIFEEESPVLFECTPLCSCWNICPNRLVQKGIPFPLQVIKTTNKGWGLRTLNPIPLGSFILSYVGELITDEEAERRNADTYLFNLDLKTSGDEPNCMDALRYGNCGRFINHSCDANVRAIKLFTSHRDVSCPEIAFFAYKDIKAYEELCFNYGDSFWDVKIRDGMFCKCLYEFCQYSGFAELHILPLVNHLSRIKVNCKQSKIFRICVKGSGLDTWLEASFLTQDPGINFCPDTVQNVDVLLNKLEAAVLQTEPDQNGGEIIVQLPSETIPLIAEKKTLRISIEFVLEDPKGGIHFVNPEIEGSPVKRKSHLFTYKYGNSSRLWFPCIDSFSEVCTWKIEVTTDIGMIVVCPGNLVEKVYTSDEKQATHHFILSTPTSASNIGLAIGPFEVVVDQELSDVMCFVLPGLSPLVNHTTSFLGDAIEFFEETLNAQYPFSAYKLVFVDEAFMSSQTFTSMNILSTNLLHPESVIEQTFISRKILVNGLAEQFFGMFVGMHSWCDLWLIQGIFRYLAGLFLKKHFGNNDYKLWLHKELELLCNYELVGPGLPPLYPYSLVTHPIDGKQESTNEISQSSAIQQHPHIISSRQLKMIGTKSHFVMRIIELRIGQDLLLQAFNKSLSLASAAAAKNTDMMLWSNMLLSTTGFLKTISTVSGKDINIFLDQWICHSGVAKINASFSFNRKRNIIELEVTQCVGKGCQKYVGPMILCIQELDGSFPHTVQVEDIISQHELPCHSKSRRNKKKKIPLITGDEVDMDLSVTLDSDSPVLWVRIDPDMTWPRHVSLQQPDYMWQYQLRYERDVTSQIEAVRALEKYPCSGTRSALIDTINNVEAFFKVRIEAAFCLAKIANTEVEVWDGESAMIEIFEKMFGSNACASIPKFNNFSNFTGYFMQKVLPTSISMLKNSQSQCTRRTLQFILELLKYNDNRFNQFHDGFYVSSLIDGLKNVIGPALHLASATSFDERKNLPVDEHAKLVLSEVVCRLNMDKIIPSFRYAVTCSCLKVIRCMQTNGHIPAESALFKKYSKYGLFEDIRITALKIMVDFVSVHFSETDFDWLLKILENEPSPRVKHTVLQCLVDTPPLLNQTQINNYGSIMYTRLWKLINFDSASNYRFRCDVIDFLKVMYAKYPKASLSTSELKEKKEKGTVHSEFLKREEPAVKKKRTSSRESTSRESSPKLNILDSDLSSKIKLKIKFGGDDVSHVSGHDYPGNIVTKQKNADENLFAKKQKKKKKKKHKEKHKMPLDIPGTYSNMLDDRLAADDSPLGTLNMPISSGYISGSPELS